MTDARLRELEHRWAESRDPVDETRLLLERVRVEQLPRARLEIAAYLGHGPAVEALGEAAPLGEYMPWAVWAMQLDEGARAPFVRAKLVVELPALLSFEPLPPEVTRAIDTVTAWLTCPCAAHAAAAPPALGALDALRNQPLRLRVHELALEAVLSAITAPLTPPLSDGEGVGRVVHALYHLRSGRALDDGQRVARDEVVRWALGTSHRFVDSPPGDELVYLATRLASGELKRERLEVAAYAESTVAARLLTEPPIPPTDATAWILGLARWPTWRLRVLAFVAGESLSRPDWRRPDGQVLKVTVDGLLGPPHACSALQRWASGRDEDLRPYLKRMRALHESTGEVLTVLVAVLTCAVHRLDPDDDLVRRVVELWSPDGSKTDVHRKVRWWALRDAPPGTQNSPGTRRFVDFA